MSYIQKALDELSATLASKNSDYKPDKEDEFSNFSFAANVSGIYVEQTILTQIGIKLGRIRGLSKSEPYSKEPLHESILDSYKDLAGYAILAYAYELSTRNVLNIEDYR